MLAVHNFCLWLSVLKNCFEQVTHKILKVIFTFLSLFVGMYWCVYLPIFCFLFSAKHPCCCISSLATVGNFLVISVSIIFIPVSLSLSVYSANKCLFIPHIVIPCVTNCIAAGALQLRWGQPSNIHRGMHTKSCTLVSISSYDKAVKKQQGFCCLTNYCDGLFDAEKASQTSLGFQAFLNSASC